MKALYRNGLILIFVLLVLPACGGGGGGEPQQNSGEDPGKSNQWDQMVWDQGTWK
jgi:hypothetical protein